AGRSPGLTSAGRLGFRTRAGHPERPIKGVRRNALQTREAVPPKHPTPPSNRSPTPVTLIRNQQRGSPLTSSSGRVSQDNKTTSHRAGRTRRQIRAVPQLQPGAHLAARDKFVPGGNAHPPSQTGYRDPSATARYVPLWSPNSL